MRDREAFELLLTDMNFAERKVDRRLIERVLDDFRKAPADPSVAAGKDEEPLDERLFHFLCDRVGGQLATILSLKARYAEYIKRYTRATTPADAERHILEFARDLGASARQLRGDRKAFSRWFGHDAICERYASKCGKLEREITFGLRRIGVLAAGILTRETRPLRSRAEWSRLALEQKVKPFFAYDGDSRVCTAAMASLSRALKALPAEIQERSVEESTLQFIYRSAMHPRLEVWLQCEAIALLESLSPPSLVKVLRQRLGSAAPGDDIFVRRRAVLLLGRNLHRLPVLGRLLSTVARDPSPFVRQGIAEIIPTISGEFAAKWLRTLARDDECPQVRGATLLAAVRMLERPELRLEVLGVLSSSLREEKDPLALRVAIHVAAEGAAALSACDAPFLERWNRSLTPLLEALHLESPHVPIRRYAALARERVWCESEPAARQLRETLQTCLGSLARGEDQSFSSQMLDFSDPDRAGRVLSVLAQEDFGVDVKLLGDRLRITRGEVYGLRLWRVLYEAKNPSPDKRQAFRHTIGRIFEGSIRAPSAILSELAETRVPGEPLFVQEEGGWRPYLPLVDEVLSSLTVDPAAGCVRLYTAEGVTEIRPPPGLHRRLRAHLRLTRRFPQLAALRNWRSQSQESPAAYLREIQGLGFTVTLHPHGGSTGPSTGVDPQVKRFFPAPLPFLDGELLDRLREYFLSVYSNTLLDLALFAGLASALFVARHIQANRSIQRSRRRIPLVVGGWGTRGKSGTERLKAALMNALGYGIVSKTTGCEAMFLFAQPFMSTREMFLFRSYDKATIWEQHHVMKLSDRLETEVFLWECMALTPAYVDVLQQHWVRDDISTVTNTYPDHEDLQGPAGVNIPEVIARFTPRKAKLITTEEIMFPILAEQARTQQTDIRKVSWLEPCLLAPDTLKRFPYDEHPNNIALVLALADELGVPRDFALKEMADRVVPDLGVLKTYPVAPVEGRRLQFINGMSANERHGTLSNWSRCNLGSQDPVAEPGVWITTVVNNRADRIPRSKTFARIIVEDISADRHFLIGGNLSGLGGYLNQAWEAHSEKLTLQPGEGTSNPSTVLLEMARRFRLPTEMDHVRRRLDAMLEGLEVPEETRRSLGTLAEQPVALKEKLLASGLQERAESIVEHHQQNLQTFKEYEAFASKVQQAGAGRASALDGEYRSLLWKWYQKKIVVVDDYYISGDQLIQLIAKKTPPGYLNRIMGLQNIKGTGLDFVYRWQAWDVCHRACRLLESEDEQVVAEGLRTLSTFQEYGVLSREHVRRTIDKVRSAPQLQSGSSQAELAMITSSYELAMGELREKLKSTRRKTSRLEKVISMLEALFDAGDAVKRRKRANRIYEDMVAQRISVDRAAAELKKLNKRQKGGWLLQRLLSARQAVVRNLSVLVLRGAK